MTLQYGRPEIQAKQKEAKEPLKSKTMATVCEEIEIGDECIEVEFTGYPRVVDKGIGSYEYWGCKGYDSHMVTTMEYSEVEWDKKEHPPEHHEAIEAYLNENYESLCDSLCEAFNNEPNGYEP